MSWFGDLLKVGLPLWGLSELARRDVPDAGDITEDTMAATTRMMPEYFEALRKEVPERAELEAQLRDQFAGRRAAQDFQIADKYIPLYGQIGRDENYFNRMLGAATGTDVLRGLGGELVNEAYAKAQQVDPEFYSRRAQTSKGLGDLLRSFAAKGTVTEDNPYGTFTGELSGSERAEIDRALGRRAAQTGNLSTPSASNVVANAMQFGQAMQNRRNAFGQALQQATSFLPAARSGFDPMQVALGRPSQHFGAQQFNQPQVSNGSNVMSQGSNVFNMAGNIANTAAGLQARQPSTLDRIGQGLGMFPGLQNLSW